MGLHIISLDLLQHRLLYALLPLHVQAIVHITRTIPAALLCFVGACFNKVGLHVFNMLADAS